MNDGCVGLCIKKAIKHFRDFMLHQKNAIRQCRQSLTDLEDRRDLFIIICSLMSI